VTKRYRGTGIDGHLLAQAKDGNREAVARMAEEAAAHIRALAGQVAPAMDDITPWLLNALDALASGRPPNEAFGWLRNGRQPKSGDFLLWNLAMHIDALIDGGMSRLEAIALVGDAANMDGRKSGALDKAYDRLKGADIPDGIFPVPAADRRALAGIEARIVAAVKRKT